jgi:hypothetical protein
MAYPLSFWRKTWRFAFFELKWIFSAKILYFHEFLFVKKITLGIPIYAHIVHIPLHPTFYSFTLHVLLISIEKIWMKGKHLALLLQCEKCKCGSFTLT